MTDLMSPAQRTLRRAVSLAGRLSSGKISFGVEAAVVDSRLHGPRSNPRLTLPRGIGGRTLVRRLAALRFRHRHIPDPLVQARATRRKRLSARRVEAALDVVARRGLTTPAGHNDHHVDYVVVARRDGMTLIGGSWWYDYGRAGRREVAAAYLVGRDEGEEWALRVPSSTASVSEALRWTWGAVAVREAADGPSRRQGDVLFTSRRPRRVPDAAAQAATLNASLVGTRHEVAVHGGGGLIVRHAGHHRAIRLPLAGGLVWRATVGRQDIGALAGGRRGCGD